MFTESLSRNYPKKGEVLKPYLKPVIPFLDYNALKLDLLIGDSRASLIGGVTGFEGDASLLLSYRGFFGAIACLEIDPENTLRVLQYKGTKSPKSYRLFSGAKVDELFADEIAIIARATESPAVKVVRVPDINDALKTERGGARLRSLGMLILARLTANGIDSNLLPQAT
ncbi:MAG TPA: hypothetical protein VJG66_01590 [Patescibacteria group bacterium]|nr:hypothetical protein [Patescibacteria group bacterium]